MDNDGPVAPLPAGGVGSSGAPRPFRVGFLLIDGFTLLSYAAVAEPLRVANRLAGRALYELVELPADGARARSLDGALVRARAHVGERVDFDLVIVVSGVDPAPFAVRRAERWLRHLDRRGVALGGVAGGALILANAGLMGGRRMTVHYEYRALLFDISPPPRVERSLFVIERDRMTCAGGMAGLDMMCVLLEAHHGRALAGRVAQWLLHTAVRAGHEAQRGDRGERHGTRHPALLAALDAIESHLADPLGLDQLAHLAGVGPRQLNRLFREHFAISVIGFYRAHRLAEGRTLVERSSVPIATIARLTGFASATHFTRRFRTAYGTTPARARDAVMSRRREARSTPTADVGPGGGAGIDTDAAAARGESIRVASRVP